MLFAAIENYYNNIDRNSLQRKINLFLKERGRLFNGRIIFKEFVDLKKYEDNKTNEWRSFYFNGKLLFLTQNSYLSTTNRPF